MCYIYLPRRNPSLCHPRQEWFGVELLKLYQPWSIKEGVGSWKQGSAVAWVWLAAQPVIRPSRFAPPRPPAQLVHERLTGRSSCRVEGGKHAERGQSGTNWPEFTSGLCENALFVRQAAGPMRTYLPPPLPSIGPT